MDESAQEETPEGAPIFRSPKPLAKKSPLRLLPIDKLMSGEEVLPKNFVMVFSPEWAKEELRSVKGLYVKALPVIGINGRCVFLNSAYADSELDFYFKKLRKQQNG